MNPTTVGDRLVVKLDKAADKTEGGLYIPDNAKEEETTTGTVMAVSDGILLSNGDYRPLGVKKGDRVLVREYGGTEIDLTIDNLKGKFHVFREMDIYAVIES
jgi:chaperonin GroES